MEKGQIVYIQGRYKAKILELYPERNQAKCKVYEGLPGYDEENGIYTYGLDLLKINHNK